MPIHTAIFYTHNRIDEQVLMASLQSFQKMVDNPTLPFDTKGIIVSCRPVLSLLNFSLETAITNIAAPVEIQNLGHLSIIEKIALAMKSFPSDFVSLHEHDVLYPEDYLYVCQDLLSEHDGVFDYLAYNRILGVNHTGYVDRTVFDCPLSCLSFPSDVLTRHLVSKREEIANNGGWCYLEPGYGGSSGRNLRKLMAGVACTKPLIHVNMNDTNRNHHFTSHYLTYEPVSMRGFAEWPGDISHLFYK